MLGVENCFNVTSESVLRYIYVYIFFFFGGGMELEEKLMRRQQKTNKFQQPTDWERIKMRQLV